MMMTIRSPEARRRRRLSGMILTGGLTLLAGGAWAATAASGRYRLVLVDGQTGRTVSASPAPEVRLFAGPADGLNWKVVASSAAVAALEGATGLLNAMADRLEDGQPLVAPASVTLAFTGPQVRSAANRLTIQVVDSWANHGSLEPMPFEALLASADTFGLVPSE